MATSRKKRMEPEAEVIEMEASPSTALVQRPAVGLELWEPEALRATIQREIALGQVMLEYVRSQMKRGKHYYTRGDFGAQEDDDQQRGRGDEKPSLTKEGSLNFAHLMHCRPTSPEVFETWHDGGHYTVRTRVKLISLRTGEVVGEGEGLCSTMESKYQWRWVPEWKMPKEGREGLVSREVRIKSGNRKGQTMVLYRLPNGNLPDLWNTVLKLSYKRGLVAAVLTLPLASELFTQDLEDLDDDDDDFGGGPVGSPGQGVSGTAPGGRGSPAAGPAPTNGEPKWTVDQVQRMGSTEVNRALGQRLRYLGDSKDERNGYIRLAFGEAAESWPDVEPLGLSVRKAGLIKLLTLKKDAPPPEAEPGAEPGDADDVPLGDGGVSQDTPPVAPVAELVNGYASEASVEALREYAKALKQTDVLEDKLKICPAPDGVPQVTPQQYERFTTAVQQAAEMAARSLHGAEMPG